MYKEWIEEHEIFCKHQEHLYNYSITMCSAGYDPSKCGECQYREPERYIANCSAASTEY